MGAGQSEAPRILAHRSTLSPQEKWRLRDNTGCTEDIEDIDYDLDCVERYLKLLSRAPGAEWGARAGMLWRYLKIRQEALRGVYRWRNRTEKEAWFDSTLTKRLKQAAWIPGGEGTLKAPPDLELHELPSEFQRDHNLITALGVGSKTETRKALFQKKQEHATALGVSLDDVEAIQRHREAFTKWRQSMVASTSAIPFPVKRLVNGEEREKRLRQRVAGARRTEFGTKARSVRVSQPDEDQRQLLRTHYTDAEGRMFCQICAEVMPFKRRDGQYYFEAAQLFDDLKIEEAALYLALCPVCHTKYREFVKLVPKQVESLRSSIGDCVGSEVPIGLEEGSQKVIHFTELHLHDVKVILTELARRKR